MTRILNNEQLKTYWEDYNEKTSLLKPNIYKSKRSKFEDYSKNLSLEPMVLLYLFVYYSSQLLETNLLIEKNLSIQNSTIPYSTFFHSTFLDSNSTDTDIKDLNSTIPNTSRIYNRDLNSTSYLSTIDDSFVTTILEGSAEKNTASVDSWKQSCSCIISIFITMFAATLGDYRTKFRVYFLFYPVIGQLINDIINCLHVYNWQWSPILAGITQTLVTGLTGNRICLHMAGLSYISHRTAPDSERSSRIGYFYLTISVGCALGSGFSGYQQKYLGLMGAFMMNVIAGVVAVILGLIFVKSDWKEFDYEEKAFPTFSSSFDCVKVVFKRRKLRKRAIIVMAILSNAILVSISLGHSSVFYLYLRYMFHWTTVDYATFNLLIKLLYFLGSFFCVRIFYGRLRLNDAAVGLLATILWWIQIALLLFASQSWQVYAVSTLNCFVFSLFGTLITIITKCVESNEYGKINAAYALAELLFTPVAYPIYNLVYNATIDIFPGAFILITWILSTPPVVMAMIIWFLRGEI